MKLLIQQGYVVDPLSTVYDGTRATDIAIADGHIVAIDNIPADFIADREIDASGLVVCPGLVDMSARLREPGYEYKATLETEMQAAVAGGITSLACPPDTDPVLDEPGLVEMLKHRAKQLNLAHVYPLGALTRQLAGHELTEMVELTEAGCVAFSQADVAVVDTQVLWRAMQYAATFGYTVMVRPEEPYLAKSGVAHDGEVATRLGLKGIPAAAETLAIASLLRIAKETGCRLHLCRLSTAEGVSMVREAKASGMALSCDVSIYHLHLTEHDIGYFDSHCHLRPPLRHQRDRDALCQGLRDGVIDAVCSDHTPVDEDAKLLPFAQAEPGATGLELLLPLTLKWARAFDVPLAKALSRLTSAPAQILGIPAGTLTPGAKADLCIFDPQHDWLIQPASLISQGKNTPFVGLEVQGKTRYTVIAGNVVQQV